MKLTTRKSGGGRTPGTKAIEPAIVSHILLTHENGAPSSRADVAVFCQAQLQRLTGTTPNVELAMTQYEKVAKKGPEALRKWFKRFVDRYSLAKFIKPMRTIKQPEPVTNTVQHTELSSKLKRKLDNELRGSLTTRPPTLPARLRGSSSVPSRVDEGVRRPRKNTAPPEVKPADEDLPSLGSLLGSGPLRRTSPVDLSDTFISSFQDISLGQSYAGILSCGSSFFASKPNTWATQAFTMDAACGCESYGSPLAFMLPDSVESTSLGITPPDDFNVDGVGYADPTVATLSPQQPQSPASSPTTPVRIQHSQSFGDGKLARPLTCATVSLYIKHCIPETPLVATFNTQLFECLAETMHYRDWKWNGSTPWIQHQYIQIPVNFENCWSFVVVENFFQRGPTVVYHNGRQDIADAVMHAFNGIQFQRLVCDGNYSTVAIDSFPKPEDAIDSGLHVLHYMNEICKAVPFRGSRSFETMVRESCKPPTPQGCATINRQLLTIATA